MSRTHISQAMREAVGRRLSRRVSYPVSENDIRRWALAVYYPERPPPPLLAAEVAPEDFNPFNWLPAEIDSLEITADGIDSDRTELLLGIEGPHLAHQLNGGIEAEYGAPIRAGDVITSVNRLVQYREREGRLGLMLFTVTEDVWKNQWDQFVKRTLHTAIRY